MCNPARYASGSKKVSCDAQCMTDSSNSNSSDIEYFPEVCISVVLDGFYLAVWLPRDLHVRQPPRREHFDKVSCLVTEVYIRCCSGVFMKLNARTQVNV